MSLRALTILLIGLVLVPAGILAWFGWRGATAWDEAVQTRLDAELTEAERVLRDRTREEGEKLEAQLRTRLDDLARLARRVLPDRGLDDGMLHLTRLVTEWETSDPGPWTYRPNPWIRLEYAGYPRLHELRLVDVRGRVLWPRRYDPDAPEADTVEARLAFDLRRERDRTLNRSRSS